MANKARDLKRSVFLTSVLQNGVGRYVPQLQRLVIKFCKTHGGSQGIRDFIEKELVDFAKDNPATVVYLKPRRFRRPQVVAEYLNGNRDQMCVSQMKCEEILQWTEYLKNKSGQDIVKIQKFWHTDSPSIQGVWTPFTHQPTSMNVQTFPREELSKFIPPVPSASDALENIVHSSEKDAEESEQ